VSLTPMGSASIKRKVYGFRPSAKGYGHGTKIVNNEETVFQIGAVTEAPQAYRVKEQMPYFLSSTK